MIGYLKGKIIAKYLPEIWVDVNGVGYRVRGQGIGDRVQGDEIELFIHTAVREDAITLYGFETYEDLRLFELVISVSGVGPKIGMSIVGAEKAENIERAIREADIAFFQRIPGIGKKGAQRIIVDLKSKIGSLKDVDLTYDGDEVMEGLKQFGFRENEIMLVLKEMDRSLPVEVQVREGLKRLGRK